MLWPRDATESLYLYLDDTDRISCHKKGVNENEKVSIAICGSVSVSIYIFLSSMPLLPWQVVYFTENSQNSTTLPA